MSEAPGGTATVIATDKSGAATPSIKVDGPCLTRTLTTLGSGALPAPAVQKAKSDAIDLLSRVVVAYEREVANGEVGAAGAAKASSAPTKGPCTGLLYGRIQSGKTNAMIALSAVAIDNGFRVIVVLTSDNVKLVEQTTKRFSALEGPITLDALKYSAWKNDDKHIAKNLSKAGAVFVCSKNKQRLDDLNDFLAKIGAPGYPALILDDEADQATPDNNTAPRARKEKKGAIGPDPTAIYQQVVDGLRKVLRHHVFVQVTATPYALLLQSVGTELRPSFTRLLEPGEGYTGGESFFELKHVDEGGRPPLVFVDKEESALIQEGSSTAPDGLRGALSFFMVAAGAHAITMPGETAKGQNFLCHTSQLRAKHRVLEEMVRRYVDDFGDALDQERGAAITRLHKAYDDLKRTMPDAPTLEEIKERLRERLVNRRVIVVNAEGGGAEFDFNRSLNFIIGGNILGRGLTIENLLTTYYLRAPKTGQMDTMLQHARMYGYRTKTLHLTRVFLPEDLALRFHDIHNVETRLRQQLSTADLTKQIPIERAKSLNPTRRAVLDPNYVDAFAGGDHVFPKHPDLTMSNKEFERIESRLGELLGGRPSGSPQEKTIEFEEAFELLQLLPYDTEESGSWFPEVLQKVLECQVKRCGQMLLYTRRMNRERRTFPTGALSGDELKDLRSRTCPVLCAFQDSGRNIAGGAKPFWYPSLVLDGAMQPLIVNITPDET